MTNITNEQLEAWAGLGPWEWHQTGDDDHVESTLVNKDAGIVLNASWRPSSCEVTVSDPDSEALIAAAPALAAALLAERKAQEVEVGELRAAAEDLVSLCSADVKMNGTTYQPMPYRSAFTKAVERLIEALKGPTP